MNSTEFAEYQQELNAKQVIKILKDHGLDDIPEELHYSGINFELESTGDVRYWLAQDLFNWLGY